MPGGGALQTSATDFFCDAVAAGSNGLRRSLEHPLPALAALAVLVGLIVWALTRTAWGPAVPLRLARRRAWGQTLAASGRIFAERLWLFLGIGVLALPVSVAVTLLQSGFLHVSSIFGVEAEGEGEGVLVFGVVAIGTTLTLLGLGLVMAAAARALVELDAGRPVNPLRAYRLALRSVWPLLGTLLVVTIAVSLCLATVALLPIAIWLAVSWALVVPVVVLEGRSAFGALGRSRRLVRRGWLKVASLAVVGAALALLAGPFLGALLILLTSVSLALLNLISGLVYAVAMPFVALVTVYVYFDMRAREELAPEPEPARLPEEFGFSA